MTGASKLLQDGRKSELWDRYCGHIQLDLDEFMDIQKQLLLEQLNLLKSSKIHKLLLNDKIPQSINEFRQNVPLTTYEDYEPFIEGKKEDALPVKPYVWSRTTGRSPRRRPKWVPITKPFYDRLANAVISAMIMSSCSQPGEVKIQLRDKLIMTTAPPPYISGYLSQSTGEQLDIRFLPPLAVSEKMDFRERIATGFRHAMREGLDYYYGMASILAGMGDQFEETSDNNSKITLEHLNPKILWRLSRAVIKARFRNHNLLPKDIWKVKGIMAGGPDIDIYRDKIEYYWGRKPLEGFGCTEGGTLCMQAWNYKGMTFFPDSCFLEFIPIDDIRENRDNPDHLLSTVLLDELDVGIYELVITNFHGGIFIRYRIGDLIEVISLEDQEINCQLPQVRFYSRKTDIIVINDVFSLSEKEIWKIIEESRIRYREWIARIETINGEPVLHIYIELKPQTFLTETEAKELIDQQLSSKISDFNTTRKRLSYDPLKVTILPSGSFAAYLLSQQNESVSQAKTKLTHIQPSDKIMENLLSISVNL